MTKRTKMPTDVNQRGKATVDIAAGLLEDGPAEERKIPKPARARGGKARAATLTPDERSEIARKAAQQRWEGHHSAS